MTPSATAPNPALGNIIGAAQRRDLGPGARRSAPHLARTGTEGRDGGDVLRQRLRVPALCCRWLSLSRAAGPVDWAVIGYLGCFQLALAYVLLTRGIGKLPALEASLLLLLEPALNPLWTFLVHGETPGILGSIGGGLVLAATTARALRPNGDAALMLRALRGAAEQLLLSLT